jgi:FMN reductase
MVPEVGVKGLRMVSPPRTDRENCAAGAPYILGLGGTLRAESATDRALQIALHSAAARGARVLQLRGPDLDLPMFNFHLKERTPAARRLVEEMRTADGIIVASPSYHGSVSGYVKNALDYAEDLAEDPQPYFDGRAVGCITLAGGWQGAMSTLSALRDIVHALRGWPTPLGVPIVAPHPVADPEWIRRNEKISQQIEIMAAQVLAFAAQRRAAVHAAA